MNEFQIIMNIFHLCSSHSPLLSGSHDYFTPGTQIVHSHGIFGRKIHSRTGLHFFPFLLVFLFLCHPFPLSAYFLSSTLLLLPRVHTTSLTTDHAHKYTFPLNPHINPAQISYPHPPLTCAHPPTPTYSRPHRCKQARSQKPRWPL